MVGAEHDVMLADWDRHLLHGTTGDGITDNLLDLEIDLHSEDDNAQGD